MFEDVIGGAALETLNGRLLADGSRNQQEGSFRSLDARGLEGLNAVVVREPEIRQNDVKLLAGQSCLEGFAAADQGHLRLDAFRLQKRSNQIGVIGIVLQM